jgi:hypothetical protein
VKGHNFSCADKANQIKRALALRDAFASTRAEIDTFPQPEGHYAPDKAQLGFSPGLLHCRQYQPYTGLFHQAQAPLGPLMRPIVPPRHPTTVTSLVSTSRRQ